MHVKHNQASLHISNKPLWKSVQLQGIPSSPPFSFKISFTFMHTVYTDMDKHKCGSQPATITSFQRSKNHWKVELRVLLLLGGLGFTTISPFKQSHLGKHYVKLHPSHTLSSTSIWFTESKDMSVESSGISSIKGKELLDHSYPSVLREREFSEYLGSIRAI